MSFGITATNPERARERLDLAQRAAPAAQRARELAGLRVEAQKHRAFAIGHEHRYRRLMGMGGETATSQAPYSMKSARHHRAIAAKASARAQELGGWA